MEIFVVVQFREDSNGRWEFQGLFSSKQKAEAACRNENYCVSGPYELDKELPDERVQMELSSPHVRAEPTT